MTVNSGASPRIWESILLDYFCTRLIYYLLIIVSWMYVKLRYWMNQYHTTYIYERIITILTFIHERNSLTKTKLNKLNNQLLRMDAMALWALAIWWDCNWNELEFNNRIVLGGYLTTKPPSLDTELYKLTFAR